MLSDDSKTTSNGVEINGFPVGNVVIFQRRMVHYRIKLFAHLSKSLAARNINLKIVHGQCTPKELSKKDAGVLNEAKVRNNTYFTVLQTTFCFLRMKLSDVYKADLVIIPQENSFLLNYILLLFRPLLRIKRIAYWGHGSNFQLDSANLIKRGSEALKKRLLNKVDHFFAYTNISFEKLRVAGVSCDDITTLDNAIDTKQLAVQLNELTAAEHAGFIEQHQLVGKSVGLFIGSMYNEKYIPFLLDAVRKIKKQQPNFVMLWVGSGPDEKLVEQFSNSNCWSIFLGPLVGKAKSLALANSQLILNPGLVGLGILDSFTAGKPMITTDCKVHSPEIAYLKHLENGLITKHDIDNYSTTVVVALNDDELYSNLSSSCLSSAKHYTIENMSLNFELGITTVLQRKR